MGYVWLTAAAWMGLALVASMLSIWTGVSVALIEIFLGTIAANAAGLAAAPWVDYLAGLGAIILAFLCGAEVQWVTLRSRVWANITIGAASFLVPFLVVFLFAAAVIHWTRPQALLAAIALSTTSVALVYTLLSEAGQSRTEVGQIVLAARFVNDIGTVIALALVTAEPGFKLAIFAFVMLAAVWLIPKVASIFLDRPGAAANEPDTRFLVFVLFLLGGLGSISGTEAVVPAYVIGLALAPVLDCHWAVVSRLRTGAFAWFTPLYFLRTGSFLDAAQLPAVAAISVAFFAIKIVSKCVAIVPLSRAFHIPPRDRWSIAMLMSTGLTFGTVAAFVGLTRGIIDRQQYAILVTAVIVSGMLPALVAQRILKLGDGRPPAPDKEMVLGRSPPSA